MLTCRSSERECSKLACRLKDVKTGEKVGSFPDKLAESAASAEGEGGGGMDAVLVEAPTVRLAECPKDTRERRGDEVDLYSAPAFRPGF